MNAATPGRTRRTRRLPVPLSERDERDLDLIRSSPAALESVGAQRTDSDAALVHALMAVGAQRAREAAEETGYAALAADPEEQAVRAALRARERRRLERDGE